jgi:hypothetical protein
MTQRRTASRRFWGTVLVVAGMMLHGTAQAQTPRPGEVQRLKVITVSMRVGSTEKDTRQITYSPPPGWYVRSHWVDCTARTGNSSYTVSTVPQDWTWLSEERVKESYKVLVDLAGKAHDVGLQVRCAHEQEDLLQQLRRVRSTHHALVVDATARGEGFLRGGGAIELTVYAELVYIGTNEDMGRAAERHRAGVRLGGAQPVTSSP